MTTFLKVINPFEYYTDNNGHALENGYIYIGENNLDPESNPINIYWDEDATITAGQPIRTISGYPSYNGSPGSIYTKEENYSITVLDKKRRLIFTALSATGFNFENVVHATDTVSDLIAVNPDNFQNVDIRGFYTIVDGGDGSFIWNASGDKNDHDGGIIIDPDHSVSPGDPGWWIAENVGTGVWERIYDLKNLHLEWYGIGQLSGVDYAIPFTKIINDQKTRTPRPILCYNNNIELSNVAVAGVLSQHFTAGPKGTLDFCHCLSGTGLYIGHGSSSEIGDPSISGSQNIIWDNFSLTDSRGASLVDTLWKFDSGLTGQTPFQTSGFFTVNGGEIRKYNNLAGVSRHLSNVSQVTFNDWFDAFEIGCKNALLISNAVDINTGVYNFNNCAIRAAVTPLVIDSDTQLIDTINFNGGFMANHVTSAARELIEIKSTTGGQFVANFNMNGMHIESRDFSTSPSTVVKVTGGLVNSNFHGHWSCGTSSDQVDHLFDFQAGCVPQGLEISGHVLRLKTRSNGGSLLRFDSDTPVIGTSGCAVNVERPIRVPSVFFNVTAPGMIAYDTSISSSNRESISKSVVTLPDVNEATGVRDATGLDMSYELDITGSDPTPNVEGGSKFINNQNRSSDITDFVGEHYGQTIVIVNNNPNPMTVVSGAFTIRLAGGVNYVMGSYDTLTLLRVQTFDNPETYWIETSRSNT